MLGPSPKPKEISGHTAIIEKFKSLVNDSIDLGYATPIDKTRLNFSSSLQINCLVAVIYPPFSNVFTARPTLHIDKVVIYKLLLCDVLGVACPKKSGASVIAVA